MKKLLSLLLALALVFSLLALTSCRKEEDEAEKDEPKTMEKLAGKTPEELYAYAQELLSAASSYSVFSDQVITMQAQGQSASFNQTVDTKVNGEDTYTKTNNDLSPMANMEVWYVDGMLYANTLGQKVKAEMDKSDFMEEYMNVDPSESTLLDIPTSWFDNLKFEEDGDRWVLRFNISGQKYTEIFQNVGMDGAVIDGDVTYKIYFDAEGTLKELVATFDMTISGISARCVSKSTITIEPITITPPADADTYQLTQI